ncbi:hypothetical protein A176_005826 [Myxococcus hansupus]|uniref:Uncharacterized protein n=1 Tax=Pseudomyxococcus hansupus TaxID=1297742 RepID=A0A0H4X1A8_9BACT|nr:hypothetical protein [Myxococcus hansupus]AKQ68914.1 hypothetical protein A176_005826 [Myxococcus hansupus]
MKVLLIIVGVLLAIAALTFYGYIVPLACGMNTTGCSEDLGFFTQKALVLFWPAFLLGVALTSYGIIRK